MESILVIEDNISLKENICTILENSGYSVTSAQDGIEGIKELSDNEFDVVICDIMMPKLDGYEVLDIISGLKLKSPPNFIFLTAKSERQDLRKGMEMGADDYITKPFTRDELLKAIRTQINKRDKLLSKINAETELLSILKENFTKEDNDSEKSKSNLLIPERLKYDENIFLSDNKKSEFIKISNIVYLSSARDYTKFYTIDGKSYIVRRTMKIWENKLPKEYFVRIHRSTIVNTQFIEKIDKWFNYTHKVYIKNSKKPLIISQRYGRKLKKDFLQ